MLKDKLQQDLKKAMLSRDTEKVDVLKGLKSAILYVEVAEKKLWLYSEKKPKNVKIL